MTDRHAAIMVAQVTTAMQDLLQDTAVLMVHVLVITVVMVIVLVTTVAQAHAVMAHHHAVTGINH